MELSDALRGSRLSLKAILVGVLLVHLVLGCEMDGLAMILLPVSIFVALLTVLDFGYTEEQIGICRRLLGLQ